MCTSIALNGSACYGRNLDIEYDFGQRMVLMPRKFPVPLRKEKALADHYAMVGTASVCGGYPLFAEAANEKGVWIAGLKFQGNAYYPETIDDSKSNISPFELIPWLLGQCASLEEVKALLAKTHITAINFSDDMPLAPLHWHIADKSGSIVVEAVKSGVMIYDDPAGVLTNNPPFPFHLDNLCRFRNLSPQNPESSVLEGFAPAPYGGGFGAIGLPGDFSSPSRFVKAAFLRSCSPQCKSEKEQAAQLFHILDSVAMVNGSVITVDGLEKTVYSCVFCADSLTYYLKTYESLSAVSLSMAGKNLDGTELEIVPIE